MLKTMRSGKKLPLLCRRPFHRRSPLNVKQNSHRVALSFIPSRQNLLYHNKGVDHVTDFSTCTKVLGSLVRQAREDAHLTQAEAGKIAGLSQRTILDIEQGRGNPKLDVLVALTTGLGIDPALLFGITREDSLEKERLLLEVTSCTENEARCLYEVCHSMLGALRQLQE